MSITTTTLILARARARLRLRRPSVYEAGVLTVAALAMGGVAYATIPTNGIISACYDAAGPAGVSGYEVVTKESTYVSPFEPDRMDVIATCPAGKKLLSGSFGLYQIPPGYAPA